MKTIIYKEFGGAAVLQTIEEAKPAIQPNHLVVKVKAVAINPLDWKIRKGEMKLMSGTKFPKHTGTDFAGVIEDAGTSSFKKGDEVWGIVKNNMKDGALSEYVLVPSKLVWRKPGNLSFAQAASIPTVGFAAAMALQKIGKINHGSRILINGAAGGFGMFLLQLLKDTGAHTTAVVGTDAVSTAKDWGANSVIDYKKEDVLTKGITYDAVVDLSGRMGYQNARKIMKSSSVFINPIPNPIDILTSPIKNLFTGKKHIVLLSAAAEAHVDLLLRAISHGLEINVSKVFPFALGKEAYEYAEKGSIIGKVAITLD